MIVNTLLLILVLVYNGVYAPSILAVVHTTTVCLLMLLLCFRKVVMGGDELTMDSSQEREGKMEYKCSWLTNGYQPTRKGVSNHKNHSLCLLGALTLLFYCRLVMI